MFIFFFRVYVLGLFFQVYYRRVHGKHDAQEKADQQEQVLTFSGNRSEGMLPGLQPYSVYNVFIKVFNNKGEGPSSPNKTFETPEGGLPILKCLTLSFESLVLT